MSTRRFDEFDVEVEEYAESEETNLPEASPSTKLERRRKIEDLFEERRLREELSDY